MTIREATERDLDDVMHVERIAFGGDDEADLVKNLLGDPTSRPSLSLLAFDDDEAIGHILFTKARLSETSNLSVYLLAPLAVLPEHQKKGIGQALIKEGFRILAGQGCDLVFVLGWPDYYPRAGFSPAGNLGFDAPHPIEDKNANAWMVKELRSGAIAEGQGTVICAKTIDEPQYWVE